MKPNDKVKWTDAVSGRTRYGILIEKNLIVAESNKMKDLYDNMNFKDVEKWSWDVKEIGTDKKFCLDESELEVVKSN